MRRFDEPILVTRPYLPDLESFKAGCEEIWRNRWLTNNGPVLKRFEGLKAMPGMLASRAKIHAVCREAFAGCPVAEDVLEVLPE